MRTLTGEAGDAAGVDDGEGDGDTPGNGGDGGAGGAGAAALVDRLWRALPPWLPNAAVAAAVALGVALRFFSPSKLWLDEALSLNIAELPVGDLLEALEHDGHPPLYYLLLHWWMALVGDGDWAVRALSGIFSVAALPLAWVAGRRLGGTGGGRWALVFVALSPYTIRYATETRMYSLLMLLVLAGYLLMSDALREPRRWRLAAIAVVSGLLLLSHYWSFWLLTAVVLLLAWHWWRQPAERRPTTLVMGATVAGGVFFLPWVPSFLYQAAHTGTPWGGPFRPTAILHETLADMGGGSSLAEGAIGGFTVALLCLLALFVVRGDDDHRLVLDLGTTPTVRVELAVVVLTMAIGWLVAYPTGATYQSRYAAVVAPLILLVAAVGLTRLPRIGRLVVGAWVVAMSLVGIVWTEYFERTQSPQIAAAVAERAQPGDVVVYCPDQLGPAFAREMPGGLEELSYPELSSPRRVDWVDYAERNAAADPQAIGAEVRRIAGDNAVFVVWRGEYETFGDQCEELIYAIGDNRIPSESLVSGNEDRYYEPANLNWFEDLNR